MSIARAKLAKLDHPIALLRKRWSEIEGWNRYIRPLARKTHTKPSVNVTAQAGGRWSTTKDKLTGDGAPIINFPPEVRDGTGAQPGKYIHEPWSSGIIIPDDGWYFVKYDLDAVEGKLEAIISNDTAELAAHERRHDLHTLTACTLFGLPTPPLLTKALHYAPEAESWRVSVEWKGDEDPRRHVAKVIRYNLVYAVDERGIVESLDKLAPFGIGKADAIKFAKIYLASRPLLVQTKRRVGLEAARRGLARTAFGLPRQLFGDERTRRKEGWSHTISGTVSTMGNLAAIRIADAYPSAWLALNAHDSQVWVFPEYEAPEEVVTRIKPMVEGPWTVWGQTYTFGGTWYVYTSDGKRRKV